MLEAGRSIITEKEWKLENILSDLFTYLLPATFRKGLIPPFSFELGPDQAENCPFHSLLWVYREGEI